MFKRYILLVLWLALVLVGTWAYFAGFLWLLEEHPIKLIIAILIAGPPIGFYATRYANRKAQRSAIWSGLRDRIAKGGLSISEPDLKELVLGAAFIDDVVFKSVTIFVTKDGIRLDALFSDDRPISIPWTAIQRVDRLTQVIKGESVSAAAIRALEAEVKLVIAPWDDKQNELIPSTVGVSEFRVSK